MLQNDRDYVTRRFNASSAGLKSSWAAPSLRQRFTRSPDPTGARSQPKRDALLMRLSRMISGFLCGIELQHMKLQKIIISSVSSISQFCFLHRSAFLVLSGTAAVFLASTAAAVVPFTFNNTGSLATGRYYQTSTVLQNGKVLVAGGYNSGYLTSAELYDPATGTWTTTGSLSTGRFLHTATLLRNGKVLVAGGRNSSGYVASAELYDPASGTWTVTGSLITARQIHSATLLPNGKVLIAGG